MKERTIRLLGTMNYGAGCIFTTAGAITQDWFNIGVGLFVLFAGLVAVIPMAWGQNE